MTQDLGKILLDEFSQLQGERKLWEDQWQIIGELIHGTKQNFTTQNAPGERLSDERYDSTAVFANQTFASSLIGMLWPNGAKSMKLVIGSDIPESQENKDYFDKATEIMINEMDNPEAGLVTALDEYNLDQGAFGTSGVGVFKETRPGASNALRYEAWGAMQLYIAEGENGKVDTIFRMFEWPLRRIIATYGVQNLSKKLQEQSKTHKHLNEKHKIIHVLRPREDRDPSKKGNRNMPIMSVHLEYEGGHIIRESGFAELPVKVTRFRKLPYETYGRSSGSIALSDVLELDFLRERFSVNVEKAGDPPLVVLDDGKLNNGVVDTTAGAINVFDISGRMSGTVDPVRPLNTVGELNTTLTRIEQLKDNISQYFFLDKLLDFNNQTQMTASETLIRDRIRGAAMGSIFNRQIAELYDPLVNLTFNNLLEMGRLGVRANSPEAIELEAIGQTPLIIPEDIATAIEEGKDVYKIKYFTPAARALQQQNAGALNQLVEFKLALQQSNPEVADLFNDDEALKEAGKIAGLPNNVLRSQEEADEIRENRQEQLAQQQQIDQVQQGSEVARNLNQAQII